MTNRWILQLSPRTAVWTLTAMSLPLIALVALMVAEEDWAAVATLLAILAFGAACIAVVWVRAVRPGNRWPARP